VPSAAGCRSVRGRIAPAARGRGRGRFPHDASLRRSWRRTWAGRPYACDHTAKRGAEYAQRKRRRPLRAAALCLLIVTSRGLDDLGVGEIRCLRQREKIIRVVAVRGFPVAFRIAVAALEGDVVESALFRRVLPDAGGDETDADLGDRGVLGFSGFVFLRVLQ